MKVRTFVKMFDMLQHVEIYPVCNPTYPNQFMFEEEVSEDKPLYKGYIKNLPYFLLDCKIVTEFEEDPLYTPVDCRKHNELPGASVLVFCVKEPEGY